MSTELTTEVNRDPYPFPRLENDEKFGPTMVLTFLDVHTCIDVVIHFLVTSTNRKGYSEARRARPMGETKSNTNFSEHAKGGVSL